MKRTKKKYFHILTWSQSYVLYLSIIIIYVTVCNFDFLKWFFSSLVLLPPVPSYFLSYSIFSLYFRALNFELCFSIFVYVQTIVTFLQKWIFYTPDIHKYTEEKNSQKNCLSSNHTEDWSCKKMSFEIFFICSHVVWLLFVWSLCLCECVVYLYTFRIHFFTFHTYRDTHAEQAFVRNIFSVFFFFTFLHWTRRNHLTLYIFV